MNWDFKRWLRHEFTGKRALRRVLPPVSMERLTCDIAASEKRHGGELRLVVECALDLPLLWQGVSAHQRAIKMFSDLHVWDTEANNGVLIYLLLADRHVQIVADRGLDHIVGKAEWERICGVMEQAFRQGHFEEGLRQGIAEITGHLERNFPHRDDDANELPDEPIVM